ncbi:MAG: hypothetical protein M1831_005455 [Alyxoria varia]|nr:MAG: hypothetical protein M1831_005455 [Alyxoria varia]
MGISQRSRRLVANAVAAHKTKITRLPPTPSFHPTYKKAHDPTLSHSHTYRFEPWEVVRVRNEPRIAARDRSGLWVTIVAPMKVSSKVVVRRWCARRVKAGLGRVLGRWGFDAEGRPLNQRDGTGGEVAGGPRQPWALKGSLQLMLNQDVLTTGKEKIEDDLETLVKELCKVNGLKTLG